MFDKVAGEEITEWRKAARAGAEMTLITMDKVWHKCQC